LVTGNMPLAAIANRISALAGVLESWLTGDPTKALAGVVGTGAGKLMGSAGMGRQGQMAWEFTYGKGAETMIDHEINGTPLKHPLCEKGFCKK